MKTMILVPVAVLMLAGCSTFSGKPAEPAQRSDQSPRDPAFEAQVVESCAFVQGDTEIYPPYNMQVDIMVNKDGYFAKLMYKPTGKLINPEIPVMFKGSRQSDGWVYEATPKAAQSRKVRFKLEMYRNPRTETTVHAHLDFEEGASNFRAHRLGCKRLNIVN